MTTFALLSIIVTLGALFSFLSVRLLRLPATLGTMVLSLCSALLLIAVGHQAPMLQRMADGQLSRIDFNGVVLHGMLAFLLFAGALQLDVKQLMKERVPVLVLAVVATALSTVFVAFAFRSILLLFRVKVSITGAFLFGALISPTDPIAVLDMLRRAGAPVQLEVRLAGESLFNDGVGAVIFLALLGASTGDGFPTARTFGWLLLLKAGGGIALGLGLGALTYKLLGALDSYRIEVMMTLALAMGGYALADALNVSAPLEVVAAGLVVSGQARKLVMSEETREHLERFWELIDDFLNVVLFLLLGLQLLVLPFTRTYVFAGLVAIPVVLLARFASVGLCVRVLSICGVSMGKSVVLLTWGGLRGALAVALAISLPARGDEHNLLLLASFMVVVFSILIQGLTLPGLVRRLAPRT